MTIFSERNPCAIESNYLGKTEPLSNRKEPVGQLFGFPNMAARARNQLLWSGRLNVVLKMTGSDPPLGLS
jgi:hypothetical protein